MVRDLQQTAKLSRGVEPADFLSVGLQAKQDQEFLFGQDSDALPGTREGVRVVADIHEAIEPLRHALAEFHGRGVEVVVNLGDACDTFTPVGRSAEVVALLREAGAVGVWGNHDVGLCNQVSNKVRHATDPAVLEYMASMRPQLVLEDCRFSHVEPWLDATRVENLWYFDGVRDTPEKADRSFAAVPERFLFVGHFHRWLVMTPAGAVQWNGERPLELREAVDTRTSVLTPIRSSL